MAQGPIMGDALEVTQAPKGWHCIPRRFCPTGYGDIPSRK